MCVHKKFEVNFQFLFYGGYFFEWNVLPYTILLCEYYRLIMSSPGQRRGLCGYIMAGYDKHKVCGRCRDKKKGEDNCVKNLPALAVMYSLKSRRSSLLLPNIKKKEKREAKAAEESSSNLVDPSTVSVIGLAKDNEPMNSKEMSTTPAGAKVKKIPKSSETVSSTPEVVKARKEDKTPDSRVAKRKASKKKHSSPGKTSTASTDSKLEAMDLKWAERFSRLEALFLSKSLTQPAPTFQSVKVTPVKPPPAGALDSSEPFFAPTRPTDQSTSSLQQTADQPQPVNRPTTDQTTDSVVKPSASTTCVEPTYNPSDSDMDTDSNADIDCPLCVWVILRKVNFLTLTRRSLLLKLSKPYRRNTVIEKP